MTARPSFPSSALRPPTSRPELCDKGSPITDRALDNRVVCTISSALRPSTPAMPWPLPSATVGTAAFPSQPELSDKGLPPTDCALDKEMVRTILSALRHSTPPMPWLLPSATARAAAFPSQPELCDESPLSSLRSLLSAGAPQ